MFKIFCLSYFKIQPYLEVYSIIWSWHHHMKPIQKKTNSKCFFRVISDEWNKLLETSHLPESKNYDIYVPLSIMCRILSNGSQMIRLGLVWWWIVAGLFFSSSLVFYFPSPVSLLSLTDLSSSIDFFLKSKLKILLSFPAACSLLCVW